MTIQELKNGVANGMVVTFMGKKVNLFSKNGVYFSATKGNNIYNFDIEFSNDFFPFITGHYLGEKDLFSFDLENSGLKFEL
jgi:hypothetical protein